ncbi:MAG: DinB family protein [Caldilineaceae bacterium]|nr:DinB family protein [Caldilineaceae bacterium]
MTTPQQPLPSPAQLADDLAKAMHILWDVVAQLEPDEIESAQVSDGWTPKAVVAHIAFWDDFQTRRMAAALTGESAQGGFARPATDNDTRALHDASRSWDEIAAEAQAARAYLVDFTRTLLPEALGRDYPEGERTLSLLGQIKHMARHVHEHRRAVEHYCGSPARWSRPALRALMEAQNTNLLDSIAGLSEVTMVATPVCGVWSIRDVLAHVLSWNEYCVHLLAQWPEPNPATIAEWLWQPGDTMDSMNARLMEARTQLTIIEIADGLATCHRKIMTAFDRFGDADLQSEGHAWGGPGVLSGFFYEIALHEAEHATQVWAYRAGE